MAMIRKREDREPDSLMRRAGRSRAEIGELVGQRSRIVTADRYTHAMPDYREINRAKLLERARTVHTSVHTTRREMSVRRDVLGQYLHHRNPLLTAGFCVRAPTEGDRAQRGVTLFYASVTRQVLRAAARGSVALIPLVRI
jgi:hypothetical protein